MRFRKLFKESFLVMAWVLSFIWMLSNIKITPDIFNPISDAFKDFKLSDIVFSHLRENQEVEDRIVLVNVGNLKRDGIAELVNVINKYEPKAIGIDVFFRKLKGPEFDLPLESSFSHAKNLVLVSELHENIRTGIIDSISYSNPVFMQYASPAFADMIAEGKHSLNTTRNCIPTEMYGDDTLLSFPTKLAQLYDKEKVDQYLLRRKDSEIINYQGNINIYSEGSVSNSKTIFTALDWDQVLNEEFTPDIIKGKIVMLGYMGEYIGDNDWQDKFCTPLNKQYVGRTAPDMYGVVVHANIVSMILKEQFIDDMPFWLNLCISLIGIFLNIWIFNWLHLNTTVWWDGISMIVSLIGVFVMGALSVMIFNKFNYNFDITLPSIALLLSGNLIELYWGIIKPLYNRTKEKYIPLQTFNKTPDSI